MVYILNSQAPPMEITKRGLIAVVVPQATSGGMHPSEKVNFWKVVELRYLRNAEGHTLFHFVRLFCRRPEQLHEETRDKTFIPTVREAKICRALELFCCRQLPHDTFSILKLHHFIFFHGIDGEHSCTTPKHCCSKRSGAHASFLSFPAPHAGTTSRKGGVI